MCTFTFKKCINLSSYFLEPLRLYGKGDYAFTDVKEMAGSEDFDDLPVEIRKCQNRETVLECEAKKYLDLGRKKCGCIPHHLKSFSTAVSYQYSTSLPLLCSRMILFVCPLDLLATRMM